MTILDIVLPETIRLQPVGGDAYSTSIFTSLSGVEQRVGHRGAPLGRWIVNTSVLPRSDLEEFTNIFHACKGRLYGFLFKDWSDHILNKEVIGTANGRVFSIVRNFSSPPAATRKVGKLGGDTSFYRGTTRLYAAHKLAHTKDGAVTGEVVTFSSNVTGLSSSNTLNIYGDYYKAARFDVDGANVTVYTDDLLSWGTIPIKEVRLA